MRGRASRLRPARAFHDAMFATDRLSSAADCGANSIQSHTSPQETLCA